MVATAYRPEKILSQRISILIQKLCLQGHLKFSKTANRLQIFVVVENMP